ncbi:MAG: HEAT repeat domain-containing protein [Planctomycetes bacterium]|nr:HEAT repeat domain-containing protein [Planctomycetota bacterium]
MPPRTSVPPNVKTSAGGGSGSSRRCAPSGRSGRGRGSRNDRPPGRPCRSPAGPLHAPLFHDPRTEPQCLKCHSTGSEVPPDQRERTWQVSEGVTCEACHGPGSDYRARSVMEEPDLARASGLRTPGPEDCAVCHNSDCRAFVSFDFEPFRARITHPRPKRDEPVLPPPWKELDGRSPVCREDFNRVYDAARLQSRPLLVDLHPGIGCPRCEEMAPVLSDPRVVAEMAPYVRVRIRRPTPSVLLDFGLNDCAEVVIAPDGARRKNCYGALTPELFAHVLRRMAFPGPAGGRVRPSESLPADRLAQLRPYLVDLPRSGEGYGRTVVSEFSRTGRAALPVLQEALWDSEPDIAVHALLLMPACHPPPAPGEDRVAETDTLLDLLAFATDPRPDLRSAAVHALGRLGDRRATSFIARYSIHDYDPGTAFLAFRALGALADPTATPRLLDFIRDPRSGFRGLPGPIDAIPVLYAASDPGAIASIRALGDLPRLRPALAALLGERRDRASLPMLLRWFADPDEPFEVRNEVLFSAAKIGDPTAAASLEVGLSDANVEIRAGVCEIWGALRATDQAPRLLRFLENEKHQVPRAYALKALGELCAPGVPGDRPAVSDSDRSAARSACVAGVADRHPLVRNQAIEALRQMGDPVGWLLREALEDRTTSDVEDRKALTVAARTLAEIGDRRAVPGLVETLDGDDLDTSRVVSIALETLTGNRVPPETRLDYDVDRLLLAAVGAEAVQFRRREILRAVELKIDAWRQWWEGAANLWEAGGEDGASVSGALQPAGMEVRLVEALAAGGEDPAAGAHEFSLWAVLTFRDDKGAPIAPAGWVKVGVPDRGPGTDPLPPFLGRGIRRPVVRGHWAPASHADPDWALAAEVGASGSHGHAGSLWLFLGSGIASEASRLPSLRVEFLGPRGSLTADTAPLRY